MSLPFKVRKQLPIVAPMVDQSELPFRMLCRKVFGKELICYTPMLHSRLFVEDKNYRDEKFTTCEEDRPLVVQICGHDPEIMLEAAKIVENRCDAIDINLGCPQKIARRGNYGSFLLEKFKSGDRTIGEVVKYLSDNLSVPIFCKIRVFDNEEQTLAVSKFIEESGCKLLTVHGRTKRQNKNVDHANWDLVKKIKSELSIPVISNGSIGNLHELQSCLEQTNCDGVMTSEAILENPYPLFLDGKVPTQFDVAREYLSFCEKYPGATSKMKRTHLFRFLHGPISNHSEFRPIIGKAHQTEFLEKINQLETFHNQSACKHPSCTKLFEGKYGWWYARHRNSEITKEKKRKLDILKAQLEKRKKISPDLH
eukprot:maker-scaffold_4-snap-gene-16.5-mRNA-1 protein AED:0.02 eAED:0.02 QI:0/0/0.5/1/1/1/2/491/366